MFKNFLEKDLSDVLMVKLQTIDIYLGHMRLKFFSSQEMFPKIRQMHTMAYRPAIKNVNNLGFILFQRKKI